MYCFFISGNEPVVLARSISLEVKVKPSHSGTMSLHIFKTIRVAELSVTLKILTDAYSVVSTLGR
jgi:hypothetical protein